MQNFYQSKKSQNDKNFYRIKKLRTDLNLQNSQMEVGTLPQISQRNEISNKVSELSSFHKNVAASNLDAIGELVQNLSRISEEGKGKIAPQNLEKLPVKVKPPKYTSIEEFTVDEKNMDLRAHTMAFMKRLRSNLHDYFKITAIGRNNMQMLDQMLRIMVKWVVIQEV